MVIKKLLIIDLEIYSSYLDLDVPGSIPHGKERV